MIECERFSSGIRVVSCIRAVRWNRVFVSYFLSFGCRFVPPKLVAERGYLCTVEEMSEIAESTGSAEDDADANEVLLEELKRQKRVFKMQLTKLYTRLMTLMSEETIDREAILTALENVEEKNWMLYKSWKT